MTLTIDLPDETAARARAVAAKRGLDLNTFAAAAIADASEFPFVLSEEEVMAAIREGINDADAGRYLPLEVWRAQIDAEDRAVAKAAA